MDFFRLRRPRTAGHGAGGAPRQGFLHPLRAGRDQTHCVLEREGAGKLSSRHIHPKKNPANNAGLSVSILVRDTEPTPHRLQVKTAGCAYAVIASFSSSRREGSYPRDLGNFFIKTAAVRPFRIISVPISRVLGALSGKQIRRSYVCLLVLFRAAPSLTAVRWRRIRWNHSLTIQNN